MAALEAAARAEGIAPMSLSIDTDNPARHPYERFDYVELSVDDEGVRMLKLL